MSFGGFEPLVLAALFGFGRSQGVPGRPPLHGGDTAASMEFSKQMALYIFNRLPIVDAGTSAHIHRPVYDCSSDLFEVPCSRQCYESRDNDYHWSKYDEGFTQDRDAVEKRVSDHATVYSGHTGIVDGGDCLIVVVSDSLLQSGGKVWRFVRTGPSEWFGFRWSAGMRPKDKRLDPPFMLEKLYNDPQWWMDRERKMQKAWRQNANYRSASALCTHLGRHG